MGGYPPDHSPLFFPCKVSPAVPYWGQLGRALRFWKLSNGVEGVI